MITNKKTFIIGMTMLISFSMVFILIMSPIFGEGRNGLVYADDMFNSLSKGSAYFIDQEATKAENYAGTGIDVTLTAADEAQAQAWITLYTAAGANVNATGTEVAIRGDLGNIINTVLADTDAMYNNNGTALTNKYGLEGREATYAWYNSFKVMDEVLKNQQRFGESAAINSVIKKAVEPAYNYYGIEIKKVADYKGTVFFLMAFYLVYTLWYGFAIYYICDGVGISMTKAAKKVEA